jgi:hypothetical protein
MRCAQPWCLKICETLPDGSMNSKAAARGKFSLDLDGPYRLLLVANHTPVPARPEGGIDWTRITAVETLGVENTYE